MTWVDWLFSGFGFCMLLLFGTWIISGVFSRKELVNRDMGEHYGDLEYKLPPELDVTDRMDTLMGAITELAVTPKPPAIPLQEFMNGGISSVRLQQKWQYEKLLKLVWETAGLLVTDGRFHVKQVEPGIYEGEVLL
jgi:hypothetical protein